jgi:hypothetical protein
VGYTHFVLIDAFFIVLDQIKQLIHEYEHHSQVDAERKKCIRSPKPFVGRVARFQVSESGFCTLDLVDIYYLDNVPLGAPLKFSHSITFLTTWDEEKGEPLQMRRVSNHDLRFWKKRTNHNHVSYLYCQPGFILSLSLSLSSIHSKALNTSTSFHSLCVSVCV